MNNSTITFTEENQFKYIHFVGAHPPFIYDKDVNLIDEKETKNRINPFFFVKGFNEHHDLNINEAPVSFVDLNECYRRLLEGKNSTELFDYVEGDKRERKAMFYEDDANGFVEYVETGKASDMENLKRKE